jgi:hypothetical protein
MKEEELKMKHGSHKSIYKYGNNHKGTTNHKHQSDNGVRQSRLHLQAFVSVGEAFLFLFQALKVHHNNAKRITNQYGCVLPDVKNPKKLTTLKTDERSSQKWPAKVLS